MNQTTNPPKPRPCTWLACRCQATHQQLDRQWVQWADLCDEHAKALGSAMLSCDIKQIVSAWVKAQGVAKAATTRMAGPIADTAADLLRVLGGKA